MILSFDQNTFLLVYLQLKISFFKHILVKVL